MLRLCTNTSYVHLRNDTLPCCYIRDIPGASESTMMRLLLQKCDNHANCFDGVFSVPTTLQMAKNAATDFTTSDRATQSKSAVPSDTIEIQTQLTSTTHLVTLDNDCQYGGTVERQRAIWATHGNCLLYPPPLRNHFLKRMDTLRKQYAFSDITMENFSDFGDKDHWASSAPVLKPNKSPIMAAVWASVRAAIRNDYPDDSGLVNDVLMTAMHHLGRGGPTSADGSMGLPSWWNNTEHHVLSAESPLDMLASKLEAMFQKCLRYKALTALESKVVLPKRKDFRTKIKHQEYLATLPVTKVNLRARNHKLALAKREQNV
jgi:hypothetical protein